MQLVITSVGGPLCHGGQLCEACHVAKRSSSDHLFDPRDTGPLERPQVEALEVAQQRRDDVWSSELKGQLGRAEQAAAATPGFTQLSGASQRGYRHADRAALPRSGSRLLEFERDVLMLAGDQRRAVPNPSVGLGLQRGGQRLVCPQALRHARALIHRRADQRMAETDRLQIEVYDRCRGCRLEIVEIERSSGDHAAGPQDFANVVAVVESS